jgi:hypothetical protein
MKGSASTDIAPRSLREAGVLFAPHPLALVNPSSEWGQVVHPEALG